MIDYGTHWGGSLFHPGKGSSFNNLWLLIAEQLVDVLTKEVTPFHSILSQASMISLYYDGDEKKVDSWHFTSQKHPFFLRLTGWNGCIDTHWHQAYTRLHKIGQLGVITNWIFPTKLSLLKYGNEGLFMLPIVIIWTCETWFLPQAKISYKNLGNCTFSKLFLWYSRWVPERAPSSSFYGLCVIKNFFKMASLESVTKVKECYLLVNIFPHANWRLWRLYRSKGSLVSKPRVVFSFYILGTLLSKHNYLMHVAPNED